MGTSQGHRTKNSKKTKKSFNQNYMDRLYRSRRPDDTDLRERPRALSRERRRFGYRRLHLLLAREGIVVNHKKLRLYREEGLQAQVAANGLGTRALLVPGRAEPAPVAGFRLGCLRRWPPVPYSCGGRRLYPGMPGVVRRHLPFGDAGGPGTRRDDLAAEGQAEDHRQRQRHRADQHGDREVVAGSQGGLA